MKKNLSLFRFIALIVFVLSIGLYSCKESSSNGIEKKSAANNYQNYCAGCHGFKLEKFVKKDWMYGDSNELIVHLLREQLFT